MKIGFTSTSFRQIRNLGKIVCIAEKAGADCIEWGGDIHVKDVKTAQYAKKLCDEANIEISSYASYYRVGSHNADEWRNICEIANALGAGFVRVWLGTADSEKTDAQNYDKLVADAKNICSVAEAFGLIVSCECHDNTFNNNTDAFLKIHADVNCGNFRTYFQSRYRRLQYDLDRISRTKPLVQCVHISYSEQMREQFPKHDPDYINKLLDKILQTGYDGYILVEYTYPCGYFGFASTMVSDVAKIKEKVGH